MFLTHFARDFGGQVEMVPLWGISHYHKEEKYGPFLGFYHRIKMYFEIIYAYLLYESRIKIKEIVVPDKSSEKRMKSMRECKIQKYFGLFLHL